MVRKNVLKSAAAILLAGALVGCENLPGGRREQGAVIGGVSGAAAGAVLGGQEHRALGAVLGGALGAAGGYVIAANTGQNREEAVRAAERAQADPATAEDALNSRTADLNSDGFVTLDEVVAMERANLSDEEILARMRATNQIFDLTPEQKEYLRERGVSPTVVAEMNEINQELREQILQERGGRQDVISEPR